MEIEKRKTRNIYLSESELKTCNEVYSRSFANGSVSNNTELLRLTKKFLNEPHHRTFRPVQNTIMKLLSLRLF